MSTKQRRDRNKTLNDLAQRSAGLAPFFMHEEVQHFFDLYDAGCVNEIASAEPSDDETRRDAAMKLQAMRRLKAHMAKIIEAGEHAKEKLAELENG